MKSTAPVARLARIVTLVLTLPPLFAQTAVPTGNQPAKPSESEPIETLSAFVVNSSRDTGYQATATLAGTRLNTPVKDLGVAISIYTKDFLNDIGATSSTDLLVFATGMEAAGEGGNFAGVGNDLNEPRPAGNGPRVDPQSSSRSRGLASPTFTRGYFTTSIAFDSYNTGTVTVNRGPNAALFGVGSAAGVVDTALLQPEFLGNKNSIVVRYGDNDSLRTSVDFNRVLIPRKVAVRLAALRDREEFNQRPAFEEKKRLYGALTYTPFKSTRLRGNYEAGRTSANRPISFLPHNSVPAQWYAAGRPSYDWSFYDDPVRNPSSTNHGSATEGFLNLNNQAGTQPIFVYANPTDRQPAYGFLGTTASTSANAANAVKNQVFNALVNRNLLSDSIRFLHTPNVYEIAAGFWTGANVLPGQQPGYAPAGIKAQGFTDFSVFDFRNRMLDESSRQGDTFHAFTLSLEQSAWENRLGIEIAYDRQRSDRRSKNSFFSQSNSSHVYVDTTVTLPTGQPNPNLGRPFAVYGLSNWQDKFEERDAKHVTAYLRYDFKDLKRSWTHWLGRHTLSGLYEDNAVRTLNYRANTTVLGAAADANTTADLASSGRRPAIIVYMGPSIIGNNNPLKLEPIRISEINAGPTVPVRYFVRAANATDPGAFVDAPSSLAEIAGSGSAQHEIIKSTAAVLQSHWLKENLITTFSWRRDQDYSATANTAYVPNPQDPKDPGKSRYGFDDFAILREDPPPYVDKEIKSYGAVLRWPRQLMKLPAGGDLSVFVNGSSNFTPIGGRINAFAEGKPSPQGKTKEYGFILSALDDKLTLRINWFETTIEGASSSPTNFTVGTVSSILGTAASWAMEGNINPVMAAQRRTDIELLFSPLPANYRQLYNFSINGTAPNITVSGNLNTSLSGSGDTTDYTAKGTEADFVYNPTRHWRILLNVAKQQTVQTNTFPFMKRFVALMKPVWDRLGNTPKGNYPTGYQPGAPLPATTQTYNQWLDTNVYVPLATALATEGSVSAEQRKWRANLVTSYAFGSEPIFGRALKGFSVGGALRWQDKYALGYPTTRKPDGSVVIDIAHPFYASDDTNVDLWTGYERPVWNNRIKWKVQLNVRNAFGDTDPLPVTIQPWGEIATARLAPERRWYLTNSFSF
jgi:hypothetical protein